MTTSELRMLIVDGPTEPACPYCDEPGGTISHAGHLMHQHCYDDLGRELAIFDTITGSETMSSRLESVQVRTEAEPLPGNDPNAMGYPVEDRDGKVLGYVHSLHGPEQRETIAKLMGVSESDVSYKGDDEDDNGPVEVWGLKGVPGNRPHTRGSHVFHIEDWAGNRKFPDRQFKREGDAHAFLDEQFPDDEDRGEFYVCRD